MAIGHDVRRWTVAASATEYCVIIHRCWNTSS